MTRPNEALISVADIPITWSTQAVSGAPACCGNAEDLPWINYEEGMRDLPQARWINERTSTAAESIATISVNDTEAILAAVKMGLGKSLLPLFIGDNQAELQRLQDGICLSREVWLMVHPDLRHLARIRVVIDWLDDLFTDS